MVSLGLLSGGSMIEDHGQVDVFIGVDVGKTNHHAVAVDRDGKKLLDKPLPQDEDKLRAIIDKLAKHGMPCLASLSMMARNLSSSCGNGLSSSFLPSRSTATAWWFVLPTSTPMNTSTCP